MVPNKSPARRFATVVLFTLISFSVITVAHLSASASLVGNGSSAYAIASLGLHHVMAYSLTQCAGRP